MENKPRMGLGSSFTANLFGAEKPPPSPGKFGSIFSPPSTGSSYMSSAFKGPMQRPPYPFKQETPDKQREGEYHDEKKSIFQERVVSCPLSSSIYYGGQEDMYVKSSQEKPMDQYNFKKDGGEDNDSDEKASRGNWWQGSLYY